MRIAFYVKEVLPWEGSIQALLAVLAEGLSNRAEITVITESVQGGFENAASRYRVVRKPGWKHLAQLFREADVVHLSGPALAPLVLGLLLKKPVVVEHLVPRTDPASMPGALHGRTPWGVFALHWRSQLVQDRCPLGAYFPQALALPKGGIQHCAD
jgi:hypothetical protein